MVQGVGSKAECGVLGCWAMTLMWPDLVAGAQRGGLLCQDAVAVANKHRNGLAHRLEVEGSGFSV